jgi:hypothetical protein
MWTCKNPADIVSCNSHYYAVCDYNVYTSLINRFGQGTNNIVISEVLADVRTLFTTQLENYNFNDPGPDEIIILEVPRVVDGIRVMRIHNRGDDYRYPCMNDPQTNKIIIPTPTKKMRPIEALSHELGHWFFDRIVDDIIDHDDNLPGWNGREDIPNFYKYTEIAALYCQEEICGIIQNKNQYEYIVQKMFVELENFKKTTDEVLYLILQVLLQSEDHSFGRFGIN